MDIKELKAGKTLRWESGEPKNPKEKSVSSVALEVKWDAQIQRFVVILTYGEGKMVDFKFKSQSDLKVKVDIFISNWEMVSVKSEPKTT